MVATYEFEYNGYLFNAQGTPRARVNEVTGLDLPPVRSGDLSVAGGHGAFPGLDRLEPRTVTMSIDVVADTPTTLYEALHGMSMATGPRDDELPLIFQLDATQPAMRVYCRARRRSIPLTQRHVFRDVHCDLEFVATDPFVYSEEEHSDSTGAASAATGFSFDFSYDRGFGSGPGDAGTVQPFNAGTAPASWEATITGPVTNPQLTGPGGLFLRWEGSLLAGEFVVIDAHPQEQTVMVGGTTSQFMLLTPTSSWFALQPGANSVVFTTENGFGTCEVRWRDAWWSAT